MKKFLKPTLPKILVFILIFLFVPYPYYNKCREVMKDIFNCKNYWVLSPLFPILLPKYWSISTGFTTHETNFESFLFLYLIISYLISCLVIWLYKTLRKK